MAWYNPATWTPIDNLQGQNQQFTGSGGGGWGDSNTKKKSGIPAPATGSPGKGGRSSGPTLTSQAYKIKDSLSYAQPAQTTYGTTPGYGSGYGSGSTGGGGGGSSKPDINPDDLAYLDDQQKRYERELKRTNRYQKQGLRNLSDSYNKEVSSANQKRSRALEDFGVRREDTTRGKQDALGSVARNARVLADSLRRRLGIASGADSSAYKITAPGAVAREASGNRQNVLEDYGKNFRALGSAEKRAKEDFGSLLDSLGDQKRTNLRQFKQGILEQRNNITESLAEIARQRSKLQGGGYNAVRKALKPYNRQINKRADKVLDLYNKYRNPYTVNPVKVDTPQLRDYIVDKIGLGGGGGQQADTNPYAPYPITFEKDEEAIF